MTSGQVKAYILSNGVADSLIVDCNIVYCGFTGEPRIKSNYFSGIAKGRVSA